MTVRLLGVDHAEATRLVQLLDNELLVGEFAQMCVNLGVDGAALTAQIDLRRMQHIPAVTKAMIRVASLLRSELLRRLPGPRAEEPACPSCGHDMESQLVCEQCGKRVAQPIMVHQPPR